MNPRRLALLACALLALSGRAGFAQPTSPPPLPASLSGLPRGGPRMPITGRPAGEVVLNGRDGLSPDEAALMAVDQNPRLRAIRTQRGIATAEIVTAGLLPNPRLDTSLAIPISGEEIRSPLGFGIGITWNISPLLARLNRVRAAEEAAHSIDLEVAWQEWQVAQAARLHVVRVIYLTRRLNTAGDAENVWERRLSALRELLKKRAVTILEVTGPERALAEVRLVRMELEQSIARERVSLNEALGASVQAEVRVEMTWTFRWQHPTLGDLLSQLPERRPDLIAIRAAQHSQDQALRAELLARFPPVEIGIHGGRDVEEVATTSLTLALDLPFFNRNQGNVMQARARRGQSEAEYEARLLEARAQVARLARECELADRKLATAAEAADSAARLAELGRQAALIGGLTPLAATELAERAYQARLRHLETEQSLAELAVALTTASGR